MIPDRISSVFFKPIKKRLVMKKYLLIGVFVSFTLITSTQSADLSTPQTSTSLVQKIHPTLLLDKNKSARDFQELPVIKSFLSAQPHTDGTKTSKQEIKTTEVPGYILNKQLVEQVARPYPAFGVVLAQGWNSFLSRQSANICIEGNVEPLPGTQQNASISTVIDSSSYFESLSESAGASYGPFSGSGSYSRDKTFSTYDANVVMNVVVDTGGKFLKPTINNGVRLSNDALELLKSGGVSRFLQACGDSFVTAIREGGRMTAVLRIADVNQSQKEEIKAQAAGGFGALSANANFRKTVDIAITMKKLHLNIEQIGGVFSGIPITVDTLLEKFTQYKVDTTFNPRPYVFFTQNYRTLPNWPANIENRVSPVDQEYFMLSYENFMALSMDYNRVISNPDQFFNFLQGGEETLHLNHDTALLYARNLDLIVLACTNDFDCSTNNIDLLAKKLQTTSPISDIKTSDDGFVPLTNFVQLVTVEEDKNSSQSDNKGITDNESNSGNPKTNDSMGDVILPAMSVSYYRLLASLPLYKGDAKIEYPATNNVSDEKISQSFRNKLISSRIRPVSQQYCARASFHPLCLSENEMNYIVNMVNIDVESIKAAAQNKPNTSPVTTPTSPVKIKPIPPRTREPCEHKPSLCR